MKHEVRSASSLSPQTLESLVIRGDLSGLSPQQKVEFYGYRCESIGLDPASKPFDLLKLNGKEILYANAGCSQQLKMKYDLSSEILRTEVVDEIYCVHVRVRNPEGRFVDNLGAVSLKGLVGDAKANAMLKAYTKGDRRGTFSWCGLGMMDETEVETIPGAVVETLPRVEYVRPGDAQPVIEAEPDEWTDAQRWNAKVDIADFAEATCEAGWDLENPKIQATIKKFRGEIGQGTYANWKNRLVLAAERACKAAPKPSPSTPQTADSGDHSQKTSESDCSPSSSTPSPVTLESMTDEALGKLVSDQWFKVYEAWNKTTADGRMLQERHKQNRVTKRIGEWAPGLKQGSREWLLAVAEGQLKEVADAN